jgi:diadenosine tetraphosphate (Ap4A) HIT family hydrolase
MSPSDRLAELEEGKNPAMVTRMPSGYVVLADNQFLPGYCLLLAYPMVGQLNDLEGSARSRFLEDMAQVGDAIRRATDCKRINYSIYGNLDPFLHVHVIPRYDWEDAAYATKPPMQIPDEVKAGHEFNLDKHSELLDKLRRQLEIDREP